MAKNKLADLSTEFAIQILKLTENIKGHYSLSNQLERSGTSSVTTICVLATIAVMQEVYFWAKGQDVL